MMIHMRTEIISPSNSNNLLNDFFLKMRLRRTTFLSEAFRRIAMMIQHWRRGHNDANRLHIMFEESYLFDSDSLLVVTLYF